MEPCGLCLPETWVTGVIQRENEHGLWSQKNLRFSPSPINCRSEMLDEFLKASRCPHCKGVRTASALGFARIRWEKCALMTVCGTACLLPPPFLPSQHFLPLPFPSLLPSLLPAATPWAMVSFLAYLPSIPSLPCKGQTSHVVSVPTYPFCLLVKPFKVSSS